MVRGRREHQCKRTQNSTGNHCAAHTHQDACAYSYASTDCAANSHKTPAGVTTLQQQTFKLSWETSSSSIAGGESFTLTARMHDLQGVGEHGGISVSFPSLTETGGSAGMYSSSVADVEVENYTSGLSNVTFHQPGSDDLPQGEQQISSRLSTYWWSLTIPRGPSLTTGPSCCG